MNEIRSILNQCQKQGALISKGQRHYQIRVPNGGLVTVASSPDVRGHTIRNIKADLRRAGLSFPH